MLTRKELTRALLSNAWTYIGIGVALLLILAALVLWLVLR